MNSKVSFLLLGLIASQVVGSARADENDPHFFHFQDLLASDNEGAELECPTLDRFGNPDGGGIYIDTGFLATPLNELGTTVLIAPGPRAKPLFKTVVTEQTLPRCGGCLEGTTITFQMPVVGNAPSVPNRILLHEVPGEIPGSKIYSIDHFVNVTGEWDHTSTLKCETNEPL